MAARKKPIRGSKKAFVLGLPNIPAKEVVERARRAGMTLSAPYVYMLRSQSRAASKSPQGRPGANIAAQARVTVKAARRREPSPKKDGDAAAVARFVDAILDIGLIQAADLLQKLRSRFHDAE